MQYNNYLTAIYITLAIIQAVFGKKIRKDAAINLHKKYIGYFDMPNE